MAAADRNENRSLFGAVVGGILSAIGGGILYDGYRRKVTAAWVNDTPFTPLSEVPSIVEAANGAPVYMKLQGVVGSDFAISAEHSHEKAAIFEKKIEGVWYSWNGKRSDYTTDRHHDNKIKRPFYIYDGKSKTQVGVGGLLAEKCKLEKVHVHEEPGGYFLLSLALGAFNIRYPYKYIHTEYILPLNRPLLVLGNVARAQGDSIQINTTKGSFYNTSHPSVITMKSQQEYTEDLEHEARKSFFYGGLLTTFGVLTVIGSQLTR